MTKNTVENKIEEKIQQTDSEDKDQILRNFQAFKSYLGDQVAKGEKMGLSEEQIAKGAEKIGNYLAKKEEPRNREEHLLQQMWKIADQDQQHAMAHVLVRLAKTTN